MSEPISPDKESSDTPLCDALVRDPLDSNDISAWHSLAYGLEKKLTVAKGLEQMAYDQRDKAFDELNRTRSAGEGRDPLVTACRGLISYWTRNLRNFQWEKADEHVKRINIALDTFSATTYPIPKGEVMHDVERIARIAHEVNRAYCLALGDNSQPHWEAAPAWQRQSAINGVEFHIAHPDAGPDHSHVEWLKEKQANGWKYGPVKDADKREHPCFVPYAELPVEQKAKDYLFRGVVHALTR